MSYAGTSGPRTNESPLSTERGPTEPPHAGAPATIRTEPTLLQRMNEDESSINSNRQLKSSGVVTLQKRIRSPPSSTYSGRTLMSRLLNHKRRRLLTPISPKSSPSNLTSTSPEDLTIQDLETRITPPTLSRLSPSEPQRKHMTTSNQNQTKMMINFPRDRNSSNQTCLGSPKPTTPSPSIATPVAKKPVGYSKHLTKTSPKPNSLSRSLQIHQLESPHLNGNESSKETQSTSTKSSRPYTMLSLMKRERVAWETRRSCLEFLRAKNESLPPQSGLLPGEELQRPLDLPFPIEKKNLLNTENTLKVNSPLNSFPPTTKSSFMTSLSATKLPEANIPYSLTSTSSPGSTQPLSSRTVLNHKQNNRTSKSQFLTKATANLKSATNSTSEPAKTQTPTVNIDTSVRVVTSPATPKKTAHLAQHEIYGLQPKYLRHNLWQDTPSLSPTTAEWSETARPLPRPPFKEISNPIALKTITDNPTLFQVQTPIKINVFQSLLKHHPNPDFVDSVCMGLREGFWPWADTLRDSFPTTHDESRPTPTNVEHATFLRDQCSNERSKGRFSSSFGPDLLPGMYSMPIHAVPKPHSTDLRLVTDHSAGPYSLNNMIDHSQVTGFPLDNVLHLGKMLLDVRRSIGNVPLTLWKSDIAEAYRLLPMSPFWQLKQVVTVDGQHFVDRNLAFGSSGSPGIFISFNSLVAWIAKNVKGINYISNYVDDSSGCNLHGDVTHYTPYNVDLPTHQACLLQLWDDLGIPHKPHKQVSGSPLTIIGIQVDPNYMTLTLSDTARTLLIDELRLWTAKPSKTSSGSLKLKHWQRVAGWFNWALNVYPLLRPALNNVYAKIGGKENREQRVYINNAIRDDLSWAINHLD
jgi:hypothetical protein